LGGTIEARQIVMKDKVSENTVSMTLLLVPVRWRLRQTSDILLSSMRHMFLNCDECVWMTARDGRRAEEDGMGRRTMFRREAPARTGCFSLDIDFLLPSSLIMIPRGYTDGSWIDGPA
jgi:sugar/nucleoside kinase (ribokinase family)